MQGRLGGVLFVRLPVLIEWTLGQFLFPGCKPVNIYFTQQRRYSKSSILTIYRRLYTSYTCQSAIFRYETINQITCKHNPFPKLKTTSKFSSFTLKKKIFFLLLMKSVYGAFNFSCVILMKWHQSLWKHRAGVLTAEDLKTAQSNCLNDIQPAVWEPPKEQGQCGAREGCHKQLPARVHRILQPLRVLGRTCGHWKS